MYVLGIIKSNSSEDRGFVIADDSCDIKCVSYNELYQYYVEGRIYNISRMLFGKQTFAMIPGFHTKNLPVFNEAGSILNKTLYIVKSYTLNNVVVGATILAKGFNYVTLPTAQIVGLVKKGLKLFNGKVENGVLTVSSVHDSRINGDRITPWDNSDLFPCVDVKYENGLLYLCVRKHKSNSMTNYIIDGANYITPMYKQLINKPLIVVIPKGYFKGLSIENLTLANVIIQDGAFEGATIKNMNLSNVTVKDNAFMGAKLNYVILKDVVLGSRAFAQHSNIVVDIHSLVSCGEAVFDKATNVSVYASDEVRQKYGTRINAGLKANILNTNAPVKYNADYTELVAVNKEYKGKVVIDSRTKVIGKCAFKDTQCTEVVFPPTLEKIEAGAFFNSQVARLEIPAGVKYISLDRTFSSPYIEYISLPPCKYVDVDEKVFDTKAPINREGGYRYNDLCERKYTTSHNLFVSYASLGESNRERDEIYASIKPDVTVELQYGFTWVPNFFEDSLYIKKVILPSSVRVIAAAAFYSSNVVEVNLPDKLYAIGAWAFACSPRFQDTIEIPHSVRKCYDFDGYSEKSTLIFNNSNMDMIDFDDDWQYLHVVKKIVCRRNSKVHKSCVSYGVPYDRFEFM